MSTVVVPRPFFDLAAPQIQPSEALYLCEYLVRLIGSEVSTFRRNTLASYVFVDHANRAVAELQELIREVGKGNRDAFWKWTRALTPLERFLLDFNPKDFLTSNKLVETSSPSACREDLEKWKDARNKTHKKLEDFRKLDALTEFGTIKNARDLQSTYRSDDLAFLSDLVSEIKTRTMISNPSPPKNFQDLFQTVASQTSQIAGLFRKEEAFTKETEDLVAVQSVMAICGWICFATNSSEDPTTLKHMWSEEVCSKAQALLEGLVGLGDSAKPEVDVEQAQSLYQAFVDLAFGIPDLSCIELMKLLSSIGRAYHAQALAIISLCAEAVQYHIEQPNSQEDQNSQRAKEIRKALDDTSNALAKAAQVVSNGTAALGLPQWTVYKEEQEYDNDDCTKNLKQTMESIVTTFTSLGVTTVATRKATFDAGVIEDKELTKKANARIYNAKMPEKTIKLEVNVYKAGDMENPLLNPAHTVEVGSSTLLSAIEWSISSIPEVERELTGKYTHFKSGGKIIAKHDSIDRLGATGVVGLDMVITDAEVGIPSVEPNNATSSLQNAG